MTPGMHRNWRMSRHWNCLRTEAQFGVEHMNRIGRFSVFAVALVIVAFQPPVAAAQEWTKDVRLTNDPAPSGLTYNFARSVAASDDGVVHAVWCDERNDDQQVYYKRSADDGASWGRDTRLLQGFTRRWLHLVRGRATDPRGRRIATRGDRRLAQIRSRDLV